MRSGAGLPKSWVTNHREQTSENFRPAIVRRLDWSPPLGDSAQLIAAAVLALGFALAGWAINSNKFFSGVVRIQAERGHTVQSGGPYRFVRHPGYTGIGVYSLATPIMLGSTWGLIPAVLAVLVLIYRTAREDRT